MKWSLLKTIIWIDKTNLRAHDLESLLEKTYEAGTKGRLRMKPFSVHNCKVSFV